MTRPTDPRVAKAALKARMQIEGAEAAYLAALAVCNDPKAPAPAKATCATTILRAAGFFDTKNDADAPGLRPEEMTPEQLNHRLAVLEAKRAQLEMQGDMSDEDDDAEGVMG